MDIPVRGAIREWKTNGPSAVLFRGMTHFDLWFPLWNTLTSRVPFGENVFGREWDLLIVLDSCRVDALEAVADEYPWLETIGSMRSLGSMSPEWTIKTFTEAYADEIGETAFVSGNGWSDRVLNERFHEEATTEEAEKRPFIRSGRPDWTTVTPEQFAYYEPVLSKHTEDVDDEDQSPILGGHIPHVVADRGIAVAREESFDRQIVWLPLPHRPLVADALDWTPRETSIEDLMAGPEATRELREWERSYDAVEDGEVPRERLWKAYLQNVRLALDYVAVMIDNVDAERVVITADHGEAFGEHGIWGHPYAWFRSPVRIVPWATTTASDERTYEPTYEPLDREPTQEEREAFLRNMGYM